MNRITKYGKRIKTTYVLGAMTTCLAMLIVNPITSNRGNRDGTFYNIVINGQQEGTVLETATASDIMMQARKQIALESQDIVFMDYEFEIVPNNKIFGTIDQIDTVKANVYNDLKGCIVSTKQRAYTVKIDNFSITLPSKEDVVLLLNAAKNKYDEQNEFLVDLVLENNKELTIMQPSVLKAIKSVKDTDTVSEVDTISETEQQSDLVDPQEKVADVNTSTEDTLTEDGILTMGFEEEIEVAETYASADVITDLDTAISLVTKDQETSKIYEVVSGDCLSVVAEKNNTTVAKMVAMNELLDTNSVLKIGDEIVVTVPEPELSVLVTEQTTYEEEYELPTQYIENDSWYTNKEEVIQEGSTGYREVTAKVTSRNGTETNRKVVNENIVTQALPTIIEKGTQELPTYIKPISGGRLSSPFGKRWGKMHKGVDWSCPVGTAVKASCNGQVVIAGWSNGYGYCITIKHSDGKQTRYGHLSKILVNAGDSVTQGEKIALSGNTGNSTGPHIHFEIIENGSQANPLNYLN
ncbi:MAG: peptidoglycan DD-metalloendopeptidase family protein [Lachnotalea sp.]